MDERFRYHMIWLMFRQSKGGIYMDLQELDNNVHEGIKPVAGASLILRESAMCMQASTALQALFVCRHLHDSGRTYLAVSD